MDSQEWQITTDARAMAHALAMSRRQLHISTCRLIAQRAAALVCGVWGARQLTNAREAGHANAVYSDDPVVQASAQAAVQAFGRQPVDQSRLYFIICACIDACADEAVLADIIRERAPVFPLEWFRSVGTSLPGLHYYENGRLFSVEGPEQ